MKPEIGRLRRSTLSWDFLATLDLRKVFRVSSIIGLIEIG